MERLVELDPQFVFIIINGAEDEEVIRKNIENQKAWASLTAVKEHQFYFIPSALFVNNPGLHLEKSFDYMARLVYPEIFGKE